MSSSIFINQIGPEHATWDGSLSPGSLMVPGNVEGFAFQKAIRLLGLVCEVDRFPDRGPIYHLTGSVKRIQENVGGLEENIGLIARFGADLSGAARQKEYERDTIWRILKNLVQKTIPEYDETTTLSRAIADITLPFAKLTSDDGVAMHVDSLQPGQRVEDLRELHSPLFHNTPAP